MDPYRIPLEFYVKETRIMTKNTIVVGLQWGDEGKGKVVDYLARDFQLDARFQGGSNAGHTVQVKDGKFVFHLIPCGLLHKNMIGVIGGGCVFDPDVFFHELEALEKYDPAIKERIKISKFCHMIMPYHLLLDRIREESKHGIGTTKRGIGPAYEDKYARVGLRIGDLYNPEYFEKKLRANISRKNLLLMEIYHAEPLSDGEIYARYINYAERLSSMVVDEHDIFAEAEKNDQKIIFEGAQGALLDINYGTYPYVTSSNTIVGSALTGLGISPLLIGRKLGVMKAYTTRVGQGPFPTEDETAVGKKLRKTGNEYGATTGRPRRCGYFDASVVKYSARLSGVKEIFLTKFDVLSGQEELKIAVGYSNAGDFDPFLADQLQPVYEKMPGFKEDISDCRDFQDLPSAAKDYVRMIEYATKLSVRYISVGADREATIEI